MQTDQTKIEELPDSKENSQPLVSIIVITYNSSKYVIDTLESAKAQTYQNIELIVSDDCSSDHTVDLCQKWIEENKERFVRTELIKPVANTGIPANCNRGLYASKGEWIKFIAGDDILHKDCILTFNKISEVNKHIYFFSSAVTPFSEGVKYKPFVDNEKYFKLPIKKQLNTLLTKGNFIVGASIYLNSEVTKTLGGFDESFKYMEDYPFFLKVYDNDYFFMHISESTVEYRLHDQNTSTASNKGFIESVKKAQSDFLPNILLRRHLYLHYWHNMLLNKRESLPLFLRKIVMLLSPIFFFEKVNALFGKTRYIELNFKSIQNN